MRISAQLALWMSALFALVCFGAALSIFAGLAEIADAAERDIAAGYAGFWTFLGVIGAVFSVLSWMIKEGKLGRVE